MRVRFSQDAKEMTNFVVNNMKHTYLLCAQNAEVDNIKVDGTLCYERLEN